MSSFDEYYYGYVIERTGKRIKRALQKEFTKNGFDITVDQWVVLYELHKEDKLNQNKIGELTFKDAPTVTRIIDLLDAKNYLKRKSSKEDRRKFEVHLTSLGKRKVQTILPVVVAMREKGLEGLSNKKYEDLIKTLERIFTNYEQAYE